MPKTALRVAGCVFLLVGVLHALRVLCKAEITVNEFAVPTSWSTAGLIAAFLLSIWMFAASRK